MPAMPAGYGPCGQESAVAHAKERATACECKPPRPGGGGRGSKSGQACTVHSCTHMEQLPYTASLLLHVRTDVLSGRRACWHDASTAPDWALAWVAWATSHHPGQSWHAGSILERHSAASFGNCCVCAFSKKKFSECSMQMNAQSQDLHSRCHHWHALVPSFAICMNSSICRCLRGVLTYLTPPPAKRQPRANSPGHVPLPARQAAGKERSQRGGRPWPQPAHVAHAACMRYVRTTARGGRMA